MGGCPTRRSVAEIEDRQRRIHAEHDHDLGRLRKPGRKDRERQRDLELEKLENEKRLIQAEAAEVQARVSQKWGEWRRARDERQMLIETAAKEEIERRIHGKPAPWVSQALGSKPPDEHVALTEEWNRVAEYLARLRIERDITDPTDTGITSRDAKLIKDLGTLRDHIDLAHTWGTPPLQLRPIPGSYRPGRLRLSGLSREHGHGITD